MPRLLAARGEHVDAVLAESHALWGSGLSLDAYRASWEDVRSSAWGSRHARFHVFVEEDGTVLSSLKLYRPRLRLCGRTGRATVLGAIFTPALRRGRGHAAAMVREAFAQARRRGDLATLLFSDIGTRYYTRLGFEVLPAEEHWARLAADPPPIPPGWALRPVGEGDLADLRRAHDAFCAERPLALLRDGAHWEFVRLRARRYFERLADPRLIQRWQVATREDRFAGYLHTVEGRGDWHVREIGAVAGDPATMATIVRLGAADAIRAGWRELYGWLPPGVAERLGALGVRAARRRRAVPMLRPCDPTVDLSPLRSTRAAYLPFLDQF